MGLDEVLTLTLTPKARRGGLRGKTRAHASESIPVFEPRSRPVNATISPPSRKTPSPAPIDEPKKEPPVEDPDPKEPPRREPPAPSEPGEPPPDVIEDPPARGQLPKVPGVITHAARCFRREAIHVTAS